MSIYRSWQELVDGPPPEHHHGASSPVAAPSDHAGPGAPPGIELPPRIRELLEQRKRLERQLALLTGQSGSSEENARERQRFPVRVHTVETRIEDRRLRQHDERQRMLKQRALAQAVADRRKVADEAARREAAERLRAQIALIEDLRQARTEIVRAELASRLEAEAELRQRWAQQRRDAELRRAIAERAEARWREARDAHRREGEGERLKAEARERADLAADWQARVDRLRQNATLQQPRVREEQEALEGDFEARRTESLRRLEEARHGAVLSVAKSEERREQASDRLRRRQGEQAADERRIERVRERARARRDER